MSGLKFSSRTDSLEFREILLDSTALCFVLMCLFMFLTALNNWPHSGHFTFAWSCWCFSCWWLFKKDLGFSLHPPAMHIHTPSLAEALCILLTWSFMYAFELVLYLQSSQEKDCSSSSNLCLRACWTSLSLFWAPEKSSEPLINYLSVWEYKWPCAILMERLRNVWWRQNNSLKKPSLQSEQTGSGC